MYMHFQINTENKIKKKSIAKKNKNTKQIGAEQWSMVDYEKALYTGEILPVDGNNFL